jgi:hypothetical protein
LLGHSFPSRLSSDLLAIVETLCGTGCEEYVELKEAIEQGPEL